MNTNPIQITRLLISLTDFRQSRKFVVYILEKRLHDKKAEQSKLVHLAFNTSLIISYARPFKKSNELPGKGTSSLKRYVSAVLDADETKLHEKVINKRDTIYGHSDASSHLIKGWNYEGKGLKFMFDPFFTTLSKAETEQLKAMINKWIAYLVKEKSKQMG